jgi:antitoxin (DNA-binding transcriptional repressor) of toxin-antitoxin stability system
MIVASVTEAKNKLSAYLDKVQAGESVLIVERGVPIARLDAVTTDDARLMRLARAGLITLPRSSDKVPLEFLAQPGEGDLDRPSVLDALLEERREAR